MGWLKYLISEETKDSINNTSLFQWLIIIMAFVVGFFLVTTGIDAVRTKRFTGRNGLVFKGAIAQISGIIYIILGVAFPIAAIAIELLP